METLLKEGIDGLKLDRSDWQLVKFGDVAIQQKQTVDRENTDLTRYVKGEHMHSEDIHLREWGELQDEYLGPAFIRKFEEGDILYGSRRTYLRKVVIAPFDGITSNTTFVIKAKNKRIDKRLLPFIMLSEGFSQHSIRNSKGSVNPYVNWKDLAGYEFLLPPLDTQSELAALFWCAERMNLEKINLLKEITQAFDSHSKFFFKTQASRFLALGECAEIIMGQSPSGTSYNKEGKGYPLINGPTEFTDRYPIKVQWTDKPTKFCEKEDILLCVRGSTTGRMNISNDEYCIGRGVAAIRGKGVFKTTFLEFALRYNVTEIMRLASGSTFPNIDSKTLKSIPLPDVDDDVQDEIVQKLLALDTTRAELIEDMKVTNNFIKSLIGQVF